RLAVPWERPMRILLTIILVSGIAGAAEARGRAPCSGKKGGVSHCLGKFFVCNDGSTSQSKKVCRR
ncbi:hypothetical protein ACXIUS_01435, partial [Bosea thiooxidans]